LTCRFALIGREKKVKKRGENAKKVKMRGFETGSPQMAVLAFITVLIKSY
jgi:hypothetical protein